MILMEKAQGLFGLGRQLVQWVSGLGTTLG